MSTTSNTTGSLSGQSSSAPIENWSIAIDADISGLQNGVTTATNAGKQLSAALTTALDSIVLKGKSAGDVFNSLALSVSKIALNSAFQPLTSGLSSGITGLVSGGLGGLLGGGGGSLGFANGGVFPGGVPVPFAAGGVIQSPIAFPLGGGSTGIAGERGAEAIMPLARGSDGRLGIAGGGGGGGPNVTFNVQATDVDSFARSQSQIGAMLARAVNMGNRNL